MHIGWAYLERWIEDCARDFGIVLEPDFQRGHVWTREQQCAYIEFMLRGGRSSNELRFNCEDWMTGDMKEPIVIVDGLQRVTAVREFLADGITAFGHRLSEYEGRLDPIRYRFHVLINNLPTRREVLRWYLEINAGGTPHSAEEIGRVQALLEQAREGIGPGSHDAE